MDPEAESVPTHVVAAPTELDQRIQRELSENGVNLDARQTLTVVRDPQARSVQSNLTLDYKELQYSSMLDEMLFAAREQDVLLRCMFPFHRMPNQPVHDKGSFYDVKLQELCAYVITQWLIMFADNPFSDWDINTMFYALRKPDIDMMLFFILVELDHNPYFKAYMLGVSQNGMEDTRPLVHKMRFMMFMDTGKTRHITLRSLIQKLFNGSGEFLSPTDPAVAPARLRLFVTTVAHEYAKLVPIYDLNECKQTSMDV